MLAGLVPGLCAAEYEYIDISNPFIHKIPAAVPVFKNLSDDGTPMPIGTQAADTLSRALEFTGYFKILDRAAFLVTPGRLPIKIPEINFQNWTTVGSELLITGGYSTDKRVASFVGFLPAEDGPADLALKAVFNARTDALAQITRLIPCSRNTSVGVE